VFLVQSPIEDQISVYEAKGFLPLENLVVRLKPDTYCDFYSSRCGINDDNPNPPRSWPSAKKSDLAVAPLAAFPSYSFSVSQNEGLSVALPIQGIPIGLNLMGSRNAHGSITITDSYTYGIDMERMWVLVNNWAKEPINKLFLQQFASPSEEDTAIGQHYLRVLNRVYLASRVNVGIFNDDELGAQATGGAPKPTGLTTFANFSSVKAINSSLNSTLPGLTAANTTQGVTTAANTTQQLIPGGTLQFAMASSRSVSLVETFPRPLVIGYIAFDLPIFKNGELGPPISTANQLGAKRNLKGNAVRFNNGTGK
jgi:hypothetical protein